MDGKKAMADFVFAATYARYDKNLQRRETFEEAVDRMAVMHKTFYSDKGSSVSTLIDDAFKDVKDKKVLASQRALQFGGEPVIRHNMRIYNCATSYCDRLKFFSEAFYMGLCGVGVGFSVQKVHTNCLPALITPHELSNKAKKVFVIEDSIEGWADALHALIVSYFSDAPFPDFDFSKIRPKGAEISAGGTAPGPDPLYNALDSVDYLLDGCVNHGQLHLRPIDCFDIAMFSAEAVLSGGRRRAATIALFDIDDTEMLNAKTGNWFQDNKQRGLANISAVIVTDGTENREDFSSLLESTKQFGEPGVIFSKSKHYLYNPCVEIGMCPMLIRDGEGTIVDNYTLDMLNNRIPYLNKGYTYTSGWQTCNLTEINGKAVDNTDDLISAARSAATIGTLQAGYTTPRYLDPVSKQIIERESLLGVSITGIMDNPDVLLNPATLSEAAEAAVAQNVRVSEMLGIRPAARVTCVKPAGTTSILLGTSSGVHPHFGRNVIRHIQVNKDNPVLAKFIEENPKLCEESMWSANGSDMVVAFPIENSLDCLIKDDLNAISFIDHVNTVQNSWVLSGLARSGSCEGLTHNVSNTVSVKEDEWDSVEDKLWSMRNLLTGIALLGDSGEMCYAQLPNQVVYTRDQLIERFGKKPVELAEAADYEGAWSILKDSQDTEALKYHVDGLNKFSMIKDRLKPVNYSDMLELEDTTNPSQDSACSGQSCEVKYV